MRDSAKRMDVDYYREAVLALFLFRVHPRHPRLLINRGSRGLTRESEPNAATSSPGPASSTTARAVQQRPIAIGLGRC